MRIESNNTNNASDLSVPVLVNYGGRTTTLNVSSFVSVGWRTLVVHLRVIKLTFQMKYYSDELGYIAYGVMTFHRTQRSTNTSVSVSVVTY